MIIDAYTHVWETPRQLGRSFEHVWSRTKQLRDAVTSRVTGPPSPDIPSAAAPHHFAACEHADKAIVVAFKSHYLEANVPNEYVAEYVQEHPEKLIGFAGVDPSRPAEAQADLKHSLSALGMKGVAIAPAAQDIHPASSNAYFLYELIAGQGLPLLIHQGIHFTDRNKLEYARPVLLDEVARDFPGMKIVIAHMGYPWIDETVVLLGKHSNVFADISGLLGQTWRSYNALLSAFQYGVMDKLLFGSGFPLTSAASSIEALYSINQLCQGTALPLIPREALRGIIERPTLQLLGIDDPAIGGQSDTKDSLLSDIDGN